MRLPRRRLPREPDVRLRHRVLFGLSLTLDRHLLTIAAAALAHWRCCCSSPMIGTPVDGLHEEDLHVDDAVAVVAEAFVRIRLPVMKKLEIGADYESVAESLASFLSCV